MPVTVIHSTVFRDFFAPLFFAISYVHTKNYIYVGIKLVLILVVRNTSATEQLALATHRHFKRRNSTNFVWMRIIHYNKKVYYSWIRSHHTLSVFANSCL